MSEGKNIIPRVQEIKEKSFAERLSQHLNSEQFKENLLSLDPRQREIAIGLFIEYSIFNNGQLENDSFWDEFKGVDLKGLSTYEFNKKFNQILLESVIRKLQLQTPLQPADERKVFDYLVSNLVSNGFYFHGFNGTFEDKIKEEGLSPDSRLWEVKDLEEISEIGRKHNDAMLLGWYNLNSKGKLFFDHHTNNSYQYAICSPEWFSQFVAGSGKILDRGTGNKEAFYRRDHTQALENVTIRCRDMNLSDEEREKVLTFFEKYWNIFTGEKSKPKVALVRAVALDSTLADQYKYDELKQLLERTEKILKPRAVVDFLLHSIRYGNDARTDKTIRPEDIQIIDLPEYNSIFPLGQK